MSNDLGLPPTPDQNPGQAPQPPMDGGFAPPPMMGGQAPMMMGAPGGGGFGGSMGIRAGIGIMLGALTLLVPLGLYKIGSPTACSGKRLKNGECKIIATPSACSPSVFNMESQYLTCRMVGAINSEQFKSKNRGA